VREVLEEQASAVLNTMSPLLNASDHALLGDLLHDLVEAGVEHGAMADVQIVPVGEVMSLLDERIDVIRLEIKDALTLPAKRSRLATPKPAKKAAAKRKATKRKAAKKR
jgi:hypothetical protein